ncbi:hypothetical protein SASPL_123561 [Salvia splendens]|uniref:DUF8040 domain-containing protein n=1 Tax=Salvia splendens TaxID=180675 RepID=A0A8X8XNS8_SALSN|nr:hypothetical protein SASPL_123561 [Salvia splendens]
MVPRAPAQVEHLVRSVGVTEVNCINNLRMYRNTFGKLCLLLRQISDVSYGKYVKIEEQVAMFKGVLAHAVLNAIIIIHTSTLGPQAPSLLQPRFLLPFRTNYDTILPVTAALDTNSVDEEEQPQESECEEEEVTEEECAHERAEEPRPPQRYGDFVSR